MAKAKTIFVCSNCGYESAKWLGKCPACNSWNTFYEEKVLKSSVTGKSRQAKVDVVKLNSVETGKYNRYKK